MDIENLIERLKQKDGLWCSVPTGENLIADAATALSTLQAENEKLRADLEYEREHSNAYHEECGQWEAENEKLRAELKSKVDLVFRQAKELDRRHLLLQEQEAELEQVKNERDSLRATLHWMNLNGQKED